MSDATEASLPAFDIDRWIDDAGRPTRTVQIYGRADLIGRLDEIDAEVKAARRRQNTGERSLTELGEEERTVEALEDEWELLAAQFAASALPVTLKGLTEAEQAAAIARAEARHPALAKKANAEWQEKVGLEIVAAAVVTPAMTLTQLERLHARIGAAAFGPLAVTAYSLSREAPKAPTTPFSSPSSRDART